MADPERSNGGAESYSVFTRNAERLATMTSGDDEFATSLFVALAASPNPDCRALAAFISDQVKDDPELVEVMKALEKDPDPVVSETAREMAWINARAHPETVHEAPEVSTGLNPDAYHHAA